MNKNTNISIGNPTKLKLDGIQQFGLILSLLSTLILLLAWAGVQFPYSPYILTFTLTGLIVGVTIYSRRTYLKNPEGIKNNGVWFNSLSNRGILGWIVGIILTLFYVLLYWWPQYVGLGLDGANNTGLVAFFDPLSELLKGQKASQWFVYGSIYTVLIISLGIKFMYKYRHNRYQLVRTSVVIVSQLFLAYLIPEILEGLNSEKAYFAKDIKNMWPLNYYFFEGWHIDNLKNGGTLGMLYLVIGILMFTVITPFMTYFLGKRWYCSWVCGCGGLAETAGDSFRQLSSKKMSSWKLERWMIHTIMVLILIVTLVVLYGYFMNTGEFFGLSIYTYFSKPYGFVVGSMFSGVIGVGFYPMLGNRVWCRFGCPLAGYMGLFQRFKSKFRISTNGGQCISCGNCSTYCEQGIDVRSYAQKGQNIVRSSCVGCGICSAVCPRGVLKLENGENDDSTRMEESPITLGNDVDLLKMLKK